MQGKALTALGRRGSGLLRKDSRLYRQRYPKAADLRAGTSGLRPGDHVAHGRRRGEREYRVGDTVQFRLGYYSLLRCYTSSYVEKEYI